MKTIAVLLAVIAVAYAAPSWGHGINLIAPINHGGVLKGPGAHVTVHGPDGSVLTSNADGASLGNYFGPKSLHSLFLDFQNRLQVL